MDNMKKMIIFDPAMCCSTGVCGPSIDTELLRVSTILNNLKKCKIIVERYNLTSDPQAFLSNQLVNDLLNIEGADVLPIIILDDEVVKTKAYPTNEEFCTMLDVPESYLNTVVKVSKIGDIEKLKSKSCDCG